MNFTINPAFSDPSGNKLGILGTEIEDENIVEMMSFLHFFYPDQIKIGKEDKRIDILSVLQQIFSVLYFVLIGSSFAIKEVTPL